MRYIVYGVMVYVTLDRNQTSLFCGDHVGSNCCLDTRFIEYKEIAAVCRVVTCWTSLYMGKWCTFNL